MKIALINENSQAAKNALICDTLKSVVEPLGHEVHNYGSLGWYLRFAIFEFPQRARGRRCPFSFWRFFSSYS